MVNHKEDGEKNPTSVSRRGPTRSKGTTVSAQSVSTSGSVGSPASRSEAAVATPSGGNTLVKLNQMDMDIQGEDAVSQGDVG